jgi:hypothetical protein
MERTFTGVVSLLKLSLHETLYHRKGDLLILIRATCSGDTERETQDFVSLLQQR